MIDRPDADALLAGPLGQWLADQSGLREETRDKVWRRFLIAVGLAAAVAFAMVVSGSPVVAALQIGGLIGAGGWLWGEWTKRPVVNRIKEGINGAIARALGLSYSLAVGDRGNFDRALQFAMLPQHDKAVLEDAWWGEVGGRPFRLHEARLTEERGSGKNRRTVTVFQGAIMSVGFARSFTGTTLIERSGQHDGLLGLFGRKRDTATVGGMSLSRMDTVDPRFNDEFEVWTDDQVEAHYLIHPEYVERLVALESAFAARKLRALFRDGELLVVFESGNDFETGSLDPGDDRLHVQQAIGQFGALADLAVRLNERAR